MEVNTAKGAAWHLWVWISNSMVELRGGKEEAKTKVFMKITPIGTSISQSRTRKLFPAMVKGKKCERKAPGGRRKWIWKLFTTLHDFSKPAFYLYLSWVFGTKCFVWEMKIGWLSLFSSSRHASCPSLWRSVMESCYIAQVIDGELFRALVLLVSDYDLG